MTELLYLLILILAWLLAYYIEKRNSKIYIFLLVTLLTVASGFRGITCGVDTPAYFEHIDRGFPYPWQFREEGFRFVANILMNTFNNPQLMFIFCAFITNLLICFRLWDFKDDADYGFMILIYLLLFYSNSMNIMRQYVAVAMIFYASRFLRTHKILFIVFLIIAFYFHRSSLLSVGYLVITEWMTLTKRQRLYFMFPFLVLTGVSSVVVLSYLGSDIRDYSEQIVQNINITFLYLCAITLFVVFCEKNNVALKLNNSKLSMEQITHKITIDNTIILYTLIGLILNSLSMFWYYVGRVGLYYSIYYVIFWGIAGSRLKNKNVYKVLFLVYAFYVFSLIIIKNDILLFPYSLYIY